MQRLLVAIALLVCACTLPECPGFAPIRANDNDGNPGFNGPPGQDEGDVTALMRAARDGETSDLATLLKHGVDVNARDKFGWTAVTYASARGDASSVKQLLKANADVNAKAEDGYTPLMAAVQCEHDSVIELLLANGADPNAVAQHGRSVIDFAPARSRIKIAELLKNGSAQEPQTKPESPTSLSDRLQPTQPILLNKPTPSYTQKAREAKIQGVVHMRVLIGVDGTVRKARVLVGLPCGLSYQAYEAALRLLFKPATLTGQPVPMWKSVDIQFLLR